MNSARDQFFAGAGFAEEQHGGIAGSYFGHAFHDGLQGLALADDVVEAEFCVDLVLEIELLFGQLLLGFPQLFFHLLALGDVLAGAH